MSELTPELRAEIIEHLSSSGIRHALVFRDVQQGLTAEQMATGQRTSVSNIRNFMRSIEHLLVGTLPTSAAQSQTNAQGYRELISLDPSPELRAYAESRLQELAANNPAVSQGTRSGTPTRIRSAEPPKATRAPRAPAATRAPRAKKPEPRPEKVCPNCYLVHAGECDE